MSRRAPAPFAHFNGNKHRRKNGVINKTSARGLWLTSATLLILLSTHPAIAQVTGSGAPATPQTAANGYAAGESTLEEIVITAQKRREDLQTTAVSADVLTQSRLDEKHITSQVDLMLVTPSLSIGDDGISASVNIRGIGLSLSSGIITSGIAIYRDGMFQLPSIQDEPLFDMASVEVLRGPQGTFVGSNSTGGAIFYNSVNPELNKFDGYVKAGYGSYNDIALQGAVNLPISDTLAARVSFYQERRDSFFRQEGYDANQVGSPSATPTAVSFKTPGNMDKHEIRVGLIWQPNESFTLLSKTAWVQNQTDGYAHVMATNDPYYDGRPLEYVLDYNVPNTQANEDYFRQILQGDYTFSNGIDLRVTGGYVDAQANYIDDFDSSSSPGNPAKGLAPANEVFSNKTLGVVNTEEVDLISPRGDRFSWIVGGFRYWQVAVAKLNIALSGLDVQGNVPPYREAWAPFGQGTYQLIPDKLEIQAGARYTKSRSWQTGETDLIFPGAPNPIKIPQAASQSDSAVTGKVGLNLTISPSQYAYVFAAKGYKAGGTNGPAEPNFLPEYVYDYEGGLKSSFLDRKVTTQFNAFYMDYHNLQLSNYIEPIGTFGGATGVSNAGASKIYGFEGQIQSRFGPLEMDANFSNVNSKLGNTYFINANTLPGGGSSPLGPQCGSGVASNPPSCFNYFPYAQNLSGEPNPYSPKFTVNAGASYDIHVGANATLSPRVDVAYISHQNQSVLNDAPDLIPAHTIANASLTYQLHPWTVELYCTNCNNKIYIVGNTFGPAYFLGAPRQVAFSVERSF